MLRFDSLDTDAQRSITGFAIELFLQELGEQHRAPETRQAVAADDAILAFRRGEYERALTCICGVDTATAECTPSSASGKAKGGPSLRELWVRLASAR